MMKTMFKASPFKEKGFCYKNDILQSFTKPLCEFSPKNPQISKTAQLLYKVLLKEIKGLKANFSQKWRQTGAADYEKVTWGFF